VRDTSDDDDKGGDTEETDDFWETVDYVEQGPEECTERTRVPGGWVVRSWVRDIEEDSGVPTMGVALTFVPDPAHEWEPPPQVTLEGLEDEDDEEDDEEDDDDEENEE